jgi:class 3 adenylate cyclase/tRNA A-37 threonylcarbamoyl transferase component Bud32
MDINATVLYARLRNVLPVCTSLPDAGAEFVDELRGALAEPVARQQGLIAQQRPDSILAIFHNDGKGVPDHARRALQAAVVAVYETAALNERIARRLGLPSPPRLAVAAGVHIGTVDVEAAHGTTSGSVRVSGEAVEIARLLECTAPDLGWSIVASERARRAAGARIQAGRFGSVGLPDGAFVDIAEITGLERLKDSRNTPQVYDALKAAITQNQKLHERPQAVAGAASEAARSAALHFSVDGYRVLRKIGEGGMASIYLAATDPAAPPQVLKVMRIAQDDRGDGLQRFIQEFALLAQVRHPNIAQIHRQGFCAGHAYIAMEYFPRGDLRARIAQGMSGELAVAYLKQTAAALDAIHAAGIVHRDLKPDNLMLRQDGSLALADFGIAKHVEMLITDTAHGEVVGTPYYLSPEQALGRPVDQRCDLYSLGLILYEMLTGRKPYQADSAEALLDLHVNAPVPLLRPPHQRLQPVLDRLMAKNCDYRYPNAGDLLADLAERRL